MNLAINIEDKFFDPLGRANSGLYHKVLDRLPEQLKHKMADVRFGYLNPPDVADGVQDEAALAKAMMQGAIQNGRAIVVDKEGNSVDVPPYQAPDKVNGEGGTYGFFMKFGGDQNAFFACKTEAGLHPVDFALSDAQVAVLCIHIR